MDKTKSRRVWVVAFGLAAVLGFAGARAGRDRARADLVARYDAVRVRLLVARPSMPAASAERRMAELMRAARLAAEGRSEEAYALLDALDEALTSP